MARDGDGLFRRKGVWYFKYKGPNRGYREKSTGKRKQPEARDYKHDFLEKLRRNQFPTEEAKWTLAHALDRWMEFRAATRPKASVAAEQTACRHLKEVIGGDRRLNSITDWDIRRYQMRRLAVVGPKSVNNEMLALTAVLKSARLWAVLKETYEPLAAPKRGPGQALTPERLGGLIETARTNDRWFVALCATVLSYATGCRSGEIKKLRLCDLVLDTERVVIFAGAGISVGPPSSLPNWWNLNEWILVALHRRIGQAFRLDYDYAQILLDYRNNTNSFPPDYQAQFLEECAGTCYFEALTSLDIYATNRCHLALAALAQAGKLAAIVTAAKRTSSPSCLATAQANRSVW